MNEPGVRAGQRLGRRERLTSRREFAALFRRGRRGGDSVVRVLVGPNGLAHARMACAVPKRFGNAPKRNRLRRLYKEAFRMEKGRLPAGYDLLLSPPRGSGIPTLPALREALVAQAARTVARLEQQRARAEKKAPEGG